MLATFSLHTFASLNCPHSQLGSADYDSAIRVLLEKSDSPITSVEMFISCLPNEFFYQGNHTYVQKSEAPEAPEIDKNHPAPLLFGSDAKTILRYTGHSQKEGVANSGYHGKEFANEVRMIIHEDSFPARNRFIKVNFDPQGKTPPQIIESDKNCISCHRGKHLWGDYRDWHSSYAPQSDLAWVRSDFQGYIDWKDFREEQKNNPRYSRLIKNGVRGDNRGETFDFNGHKINTRMPYVPSSGDLLDKIIPLHVNIVQGKMQNSFAYQNYKYALASVYLGCDLDQEIKASLYNNIKDSFPEDKLIKSAEGYLKQSGDNQAGMGRASENSKVATLILMGRMMDVSLDAWSPAFIKSEKDHWYGIGPGFDMGSGTEIRDYIFRALMKDLSKDNLTLQKIFTSDRWKSPYYSFLNHRFLHRAKEDGYPGHFNTECMALYPLAKKEFEKRSKGEDCVRTTPLYSINPFLTEMLNIPIQYLANNQESNISYTKTFTNCFYCHRNGGNAPYIPFENPKKFQHWLNSTRDYHGKNLSGYDIIYQRVITEKTMPLGNFLDDNERRKIIEEVNKLKSR